MSDGSEVDRVRNDLVERVARAIYEAWCAFHGVTKTSMPWDDVWGEERQACIAEARAAIAVLRPALRAEALEEAAKIAEGYHWSIGNTVVNPALVAAAIRALVK